MRITLKPVAFLFFFLLPQLVPAAEKGNAAKGKELFKRCSACHGDSGEGREAIAKMFGVTMHALSSREVQSLNDAALKKIILEGKGKMAPLQLSGAEIEDIIAFLRTLKNSPPI
jgi:mono/diheme cytochrome c family protein